MKTEDTEAVGRQRMQVRLPAVALSCINSEQVVHVNTQMAGLLCGWEGNREPGRN